MILAITNQKGGVGKTTTVINLAAAIAQRGFKTLLVDLDPQANSTLSYLELNDIEVSVYDALTSHEISFQKILRRSPILYLDVVPARIALAKFESRMVTEFDGHFRLKDKLEPLVKEYDYIIIDTPPTLGLLTVNALVASTHVAIPIQSSYYALEGTDDLLETIDKIRQRPNPDLQILGVLITLHDRRTILGRDIKRRIREVFKEKVFDTSISKNVRLEESPAYKQSIFTFAPSSTGAMEYYKLSEEVITRG
ncbi:MAG: ParA family protein [Acidobacteriota bacterium]